MNTYDALCSPVFVEHQELSFPIMSVEFNLKTTDAGMILASLHPAGLKYNPLLSLSLYLFLFLCYSLSLFFVTLHLSSSRPCTRAVRRIFPVDRRGKKSHGSVSSLQALREDAPREIVV